MRRLLPLVLLLAACSGQGPAPAPAAQSPTQPPSASATPAPARTPSPVASSPPAVAATAAARPAYRWSVRRVTAADLPSSWHAGCPVGSGQLRLLTLDYRDFGGARRTGRLVVSARVVHDVVAVFRSLYEARFPIRRMEPVDAYGGDDDRSMAADNTSAFNCRDAVGGSGWSQHAYGLAIDVNPVENPYLYGGQVLPPAGAAYTDRSRHRRGTAYAGSALNRAFARQGWSWGGRWRNPDYQHFSPSGR